MRTSAVLLLLYSGVEIQFAALLLGAIWGWALCWGVAPPSQPSWSPVQMRVAWGAFAVFGALLFASTTLAVSAPHGPISYDPVWTNAVHTGVDAVVAVVGFVLLEQWRTAPIIVVALCVLVALATG